MPKPKRLLTLLRQAPNLIKEKKLGDFALLKADALGANANPEVEAQLEPLVGYHPELNIDALLNLPKDTLGQTYARYMKDNQLQAFNISPELEAIARRNTFALRYAVTHDFFHVLLDFDTSYAGEMGVLAFATAQGYSKSQQLALKLATVLYPILAPGQRAEIQANKKRGWELGEQVDCLLAYRFEAHLQEPLHQVRSRLGLTPSDQIQSN